MRMAETTEYMKELGVTPALFKKWQAESPEDDEPAPFPTRQDALILAQRRQNTTRPKLLRRSWPSASGRSSAAASASSSASPSGPCPSR